MKSKNMVLVALAVGCGLVAAFLTAKLSAGGKTEMIPVLVAAKNLDQGTKLDKIEELFVRKPFPRESVPPEFIDDVAVLKGKVLQRSLRAGSHCTLADVTQKNTIELPVDPKTGTMYKAMALKVSPDMIVGGLVLPGARVDVMNVEHLNQGKAVAAMILQNVLVVGVDVSIIRPEDQGFIKNAQTVTLAVKQSEGLKLALAQKRGEITLMLRSPDDDKVNKNLKPVTSYGTTDADSGADENAGEKAKILIAKETIPAGTKLTDPEQFFTESEHAGTVPGNFIVKWDELKGRVVAKAISANVPPTKESFEDDGVKPSGKTPAVAAHSPNAKLHTMTFQVGGAAPSYHQFRDGRLESGKATTASAIAATPSGATEIKPSKEEEKTDAEGQ